MSRVPLRAEAWPALVTLRFRRKVRQRTRATVMPVFGNMKRGLAFLPLHDCRKVCRVCMHVCTRTSVFKQRCAYNLVFASVVCCRNLKPFSAPGASGGDGGLAYHFSGTKETLLALSRLWTALTRCWYKILQPSTEFSLHNLPELPADISPLYISASGSSQGHSANYNNPLRCLTFSTAFSSNKQCIFK